jgi:predicted signal transduction protein with EAL and GGDEF domain
MNAIATATGMDDTYRNLMSTLERTLQESAGSMALLLIEMSELPDLHARLGFEASAALMQTLCERFTTALSGRGAVVHFRDGSFCVLIKGIRNNGHAMLAAEKIWRTLDETMSAAGVRSQPAHIGIALHPTHSSQPDDLLRKAQLAATAARKRAARVLPFDDDCATEVLQHWALAEAFAAALDSGEVSMHYQPKIRIADGRTTGAEALMRWLQDGKPIATPDVFIPLAEESGLTQNTTWYALSNALRQTADLPSLTVAVNVTPAMLHHREFLDMVQSAVENWQTKPGKLTLEVTEGALIADFEQAIARLSQVRDLGVRISIDDFGTGYSSLSYFKKIPADELKIDKSFVLGMLQDPADRRLVETIVTLARQFKLDIVAEGVEDRPTFDALAAMGCDYAQGFLFTPALSFDEFRAWLASANGTTS